MSSKKPILNIPDEWLPSYQRKDGIQYYPAAILSTPAKEVKEITAKTLRTLSRMALVMRKHNGAGIAAPQIGVSERLIIIQRSGLQLINPVIVEKSDTHLISQEGCLSIPGITVYCQRQLEVVVEALNVKGQPVRIELDGYDSIVAQHEIDHIDGILMIDRMIRHQWHRKP